MALSSSLTTKAASTDTNSIGHHLRAAGATASHGVARSLETLRRMAIAMSVDATGHAAIGNGNWNGNGNGNSIANDNDNSSGRGHGHGPLHHQQSGSIHARLNIHKRHLSGGAIAGITVGIVVAVALLAICLYPCLLYLKRRHIGRGTSHAASDAEAAVAGTAAGHGSNASNGASSPPKRLSSSDSYKHKGELTRGGSTDHDWRAATADHNGYPLPLNAAYLQPGDPGFDGNGLGAEHRVKAEPFLPLGLDDGEFAPRVSADHQPGVLKGTSADYYSPDIPSEAFGMVAQPEPPLESPILLSSSRASSFRHNMKQMFRRKSGRDATLDSTVSQATITERSANGAIPLQTNITAGDRVESPVSFSAVSLPLSRSSSSRQRGTGAEAEAEPRLGPVSPPVSNAAEPASQRTTPEPPDLSSYQRFQKSPSPPVAAPGTVNPMDIMPASTEAEVWHRTEHQLYEAFHKPSPSDPAIDTAMPSPSPTPPETQAQPTFTVQTPGSTNRTEFIPDSINNGSANININNSNNSSTNSSNDQQQLDTGDVVMLDAGAALPSTHDRILTAPDGRHPSYPSDQSTPLPGPAFTDVSSQNTPSTQLDTPSPQSVGSSDFRHSASPQSGAGSHSPRTGVYRCEEPGCNQTFDQPHKLKHHQRYHSKDHKCPYPGCGKGFGTKTHLQRHINDRHEKKKKFHCSVTGCDYSRAGGKAFPRKDNWKRHMMKIHNIEQQSLPEPIEVDMDADGS
ncbi:hypothetical protein TGAM01_v209626 [Trichoderma gamsii]|uniref:C2H2-type domain-containing protein n=1 Tax=Trichoderma gamsii TaxID=398673 RepID=A0A2P4ZAX9_9HYPO|nr:hypothetical protein TGAM01_v209626 [Trichoderma gamsii]PON21463.1 hypothetical protein TGAM01_v209626 [Trichoderma gamsii]